MSNHLSILRKLFTCKQLSCGRQFLSLACSMKIISLVFIILCSISIPAACFAKSEFVVVIDAGHGGKDTGAVDNNVREKDINLAVAKRLGELIEKKMKGTQVVYTRSDDSFVSLQGRADIANKAKGDLFISIHTNSVDLKNKNRSTIAGASVYTLGSQKDDANMGVARRENSVIEMENGYEQKYAGFDPNKDESYIIFEMAQKNNLNRSNRFAKMVQDNLVNHAGRKDRGVHQAGFWVLWSTSMPSVLIELDFICNPESAKYMTSKEGVDQLAESIFDAVKIYEQNNRQAKRMAANKNNNTTNSQSDQSNNGKENQSLASADSKSNSADKKGDRKSTKNNKSKKQSKKDKEAVPVAPVDQIVDQPSDGSIAVAYTPAEEDKDLSHKNLKTTSNTKKPRSTADGRRRRSASAREKSSLRNVEGEIRVCTEFTGVSERVSPEPLMATSKNDVSSDSKKNNKKDKKDKKDKKEKQPKEKKEKKKDDNKSLAKNNAKSSQNNNVNDRKQVKRGNASQSSADGKTVGKEVKSDGTKAKASASTKTQASSNSNNDAKSNVKSAKDVDPKSEAGRRKSLKSKHD